MSERSLRHARENVLPRSFVDKFFGVVKAVDHQDVLSQPIPSKFICEDLDVIDDKLWSYIESHEDYATTSIEKKGRAHYRTVAAIVADLKVASMLKIVELARGTEEYIQVDSFYQFAVRLLFKEALQLQLDLQTFETTAEELSRFETQLTKDYRDVLSQFSTPNGESLNVIKGTNFPLFTSLNQRSSLDPRDAVVEKPFKTTKIVPVTTSISSASLGHLSPFNPKTEQHPAVQPTELLSQFFHPNWFGLPIGAWVRGDLFSSFYPIVDDGKTCISFEMRGITWLEQIGFQKFKEMKEAKPQPEAEAEAMEVDEEKDEDEEKEDKEEEAGDATVIETKEETQDEPKDQSSQDSSEAAPPKMIKLENLINWHPANKISPDEKHAISNKTELKLINKLLIDLQKMRQERYRASAVVNVTVSNPIKALEPSVKEREAYHKLERLLRHVIQTRGVRPKDLNMVSKKLPVLQTNYIGSLPAPVVTTKRLVNMKKKKR